MIGSSEPAGVLQLVIGLAAIVTALGVIAAGATKAYKVIRAVDERFKTREVDRIARVAGGLIDQAARQFGSRLDVLAGEIRTDRDQRAEDRQRGSAIVGEWELWRAGVDGRLDLLEMRPACAGHDVGPAAEGR